MDNTKKRKAFEKSLFLHRTLAKKFNRIVMVGETDCIVTKRMGYDNISPCLFEKYAKYNDYTRYRCLELIAEELKSNFSDDVFADANMAEAGVYLADFSFMLNELFPDSQLFLYDTFEGFDKSEVDEELEKGFTSKEYMNNVSDEYTPDYLSADEKIKLVKSKMKEPRNVHIRKGLFPGTAEREKNNKWFLVSLDMDLYVPIVEGLRFFYPNMVPGGYMMIHDYNNKGFSGIKKAIDEVQTEWGIRIPKVPLPDNGGTVVLQKI